MLDYDLSDLVINYIGNSVAQRDYVSRGRASKSQRKKTQSRNNKKKKQSQLSPLLIGLAIVVLIIFVSGLWYLSHHKTAASAQAIPHKKKNGFNLPPKPNEYWSYIDKLENRQVSSSVSVLPVAPEQAAAHPPLTQEQKQLLEQMNVDMRNQPIQLHEVPWNQQNIIQHKNQKNPSLVPKAHTSYNNEQTAHVAIPSTPTVSANPSSSHGGSPKTLSSQQAAGKKQLIQCASFKISEQAESFRAQLAFEGFESRLSSSNGWHRVVIGPFANPNKINTILKRLHNSHHRSCITVSVKG